jgi:hypothetical protein
MLIYVLSLYKCKIAINSKWAHECSRERYAMIEGISSFKAANSKV